MPTYEYACKSCEERLEVQQRFTDEPLTECPSCSGPLRKVFGNVGITFKGSGFYKTDSRSSSSSKAKSSSGESSGSGDSSGSGASSSDSSTSTSSDTTSKSTDSSKTSSSTAAATK